MALLYLGLATLEEVIGITSNGVNVLDHREDIDDVILTEDGFVLGIKVIVLQQDLNPTLGAQLSEEGHFLEIVGFCCCVYAITVRVTQREELKQTNTGIDPLHNADCTHHFHHFGIQFLCVHFDSYNGGQDRRK